MPGSALHRRRATLSLLASAFILLTPAWAQGEAEAQAAATQWLAQTDAGSHAEAWGLAGAAFRGAISREQWQGAARQVLGPLGSVLKREVNGSKATRSLPGMPDGDYRIYSYRTDFANKAGAIETLTLALEADGQWRVVGYFVR